MSEQMKINKVYHVVADLEALTAWAEARETSLEVAYSIIQYAKDPAEAQAVWEDPSPAQFCAVHTLSFDLVAEEEEYLYWGEHTMERN